MDFLLGKESPAKKTKIKIETKMNSVSIFDYAFKAEVMI